MTFEQKWLEYDYNPFIIFNSNGKILSLNSEAQFLLGTVNYKELYELAVTNANVTFGFKTTFLELNYGRYKFFGLTVGYENDDEIGVKLYQSPSFKLNKPKPDGELTNIFTLVDLCISTNSIGSNIEYIKDFDPTIPEVIINVNSAIKLLNKIYSCFKTNNTIINTKIFYRVGEHIVFDDKKYGLFSIQIEAENIENTKVSEMELFISKNNFYVDIEKNSISLNIPIIEN